MGLLGFCWCLLFCVLMSHEDEREDGFAEREDGFSRIFVGFSWFSIQICWVFWDFCWVAYVIAISV